VGEERDLKRRYRAFVKANHPDAGGDRDAFERGLAALRAEQRAELGTGPQGVTASGSRVVAHRSGGLNRAVRRWWRRRRH
jgi:hypothetical protein